MNVLLSAIVVFASVITIGCSSNNSDKNGVENERAQSLIDQSLYNEAIFTLSARVQQYPNDERSRILLASAFAAKHGIILTSFVDFARALLESNKPAQNEPGGLNGMQKMTMQIDIIVRAIHALPELTTQEAVNDIYQAVFVLQNIHSSSGAFLYRALLKLVLFKFDLENTFRMQTTPSCEVTPAVLRQWFQRVDGSLIGIVRDIALGSKDPAQKEKLANAEIQIQDVYRGMDEGLNSAQPAAKLLKMPKILKRVYPTCG